MRMIALGSKTRSGPRTIEKVMIKSYESNDLTETHKPDIELLLTIMVLSLMFVLDIVKDLNVHTDVL